MKSLKNVTIRSLLVSILILGLAQSASAAIFVMIPGVGGDASIDGDRAEAEQIQIEFPDPDVRSADAEQGVAVLSMPRSEATRSLIAAGMHGEEIPEIEIVIVEASDEAGETTYLKYTLSRCFVKSWSTSGDAGTAPVEELTLGFTPIKDY